MHRLTKLRWQSDISIRQFLQPLFGLFPLLFPFWVLSALIPLSREFKKHLATRNNYKCGRNNLALKNSK